MTPPKWRGFLFFKLVLDSGKSKLNIMKIIIIGAATENNVIGFKNKIPWHLPMDFKERFKKNTIGHPIIMGRKTLESLPGILPGRKHIVISTTTKIHSSPEVIFVSSFHEAILCAENMEAEKVFITGGERVFKDGLEIADTILLTRIKTQKYAGDAFFPKIDPDEWILQREEDHRDEPNHTDNFTFMDYERRK